MDIKVFGDYFDTFDDDLANKAILHIFWLYWAAQFAIKSTRNPSVFEQRLTWEEYSNRHTQRGTFHRRLRMSRVSFDRLVGLLRDDLVVDIEKANLRGGPIIPELCLYCTIQWLAGGSYLDICDISGVSSGSFYRVLWKTIKAINKCTKLDFSMPKTEEECLIAAAGFESISDKSPVNGEPAIKHCVGVIDGYLLRINTPSKGTVGNVRSYFCALCNN